MSATHDRLRRLPSVDEVLHWPEVAALPLPSVLITHVLRDLLQDLRKKITQDADEFDCRKEILFGLRKLNWQGLQPVVNATGVILHTNLGRAPLAPKVVKRLQEIAGNYSSLEYDRDQGIRGSRLDYVRMLLCAYLQVPDALVVNNNAAAVYLAIRSMAAGKEVVISRGELVEIGGSFRIPDVITAAGAKLCEVGTTNRTHLEDYQRAIGPQTALLLKVHPSNFTLDGFCSEVSTEHLVALGKKHHIPVMEDLGSGAFIDFAEFHAGIRREKTVPQAARSGTECLTFSGDKLLGGPQAGIILGSTDWIAKFKKDPLYRTLRLSKLDLIALEATLELYLHDEAAGEIPVLRALLVSDEELRQRAMALQANLAQMDFQVVIEKQFSEVGGGALPAVGLPTWVVKVCPGDFLGGARGLAEALRKAPFPVVTRVNDNHVLCDMRTLLPGQEEWVRQAFFSLQPDSNEFQFQAGLKGG